MGTDQPRCGLCQRPLRDPASIELGFGPDCWSRLDATARRSVLEARPDAAGVAVPALAPPGAGGNPGRTPARPPSRRSVASPLAVAGAWAVVLAAVLVLLEYWRFVLVGVALVAVAAGLGLLVERYQHRRPADGKARR